MRIGNFGLTDLVFGIWTIYMIELKLQNYRKKFDISDDIAKKFEYPIIFYLAHKNDWRALFITFVILDFSRKELSYLISYLPENFEKVEKSENRQIFSILSPGHNPHCAIQISENGDFYVFLELVNYFYYVNRKDNYVRIMTGADLNCVGKNKLGKFGATFYKDDQYPNQFYFTVIEEGKENNNKVNFYKSDLVLRDIDLIKTVPIWGANIPHATKKFRNFLFNSEFVSREYKLEKSAKIIKRSDNFVRYVYEYLYQQYCASEKRSCDFKKFYEENVINHKHVVLKDDFKKFCDSKGKNFVDICNKDENLRFSMLPGDISMIDLRNGDVKYFKTSFCSPAHFEIDEKEGCIYASSHNFIVHDQVYFLGPAAIDKFKLIGDKLEKVGSFSEPTSYRMTTHRVFHHKNHPYIVTFGQPNRLFLIDAETMKSIHHEDIGEDVLTGKENIADFLNSSKLEPITIKTLEVSQDGAMLFLLDYRYIYFYDFEKRKIVHKMKYQWPEKIGDGLMLTDFYKRTTHSNYLE